MKKETIINKLYNLRFFMLNLLGLLIGAAGYAGIQSYMHVVPKWLIILIAVYSVIVLAVWIICTKYKHS